MKPLHALTSSIAFIVPLLPPMHADASARQYLAKMDAWYGGNEARMIAANILSWQSDLGGWPKNVDTTAAAYAGTDRAKDLKPTFDNGATTDELRFLARIYRATKADKYKEAFLRGLDHIVKAQYPTGGWPQSYPPGKQYHRHITFNDDAMVRLMQFLRETYTAPHYDFVDQERKRHARAEFDMGVRCILKCQITVEGKLTAWCAQHDEMNYAPRLGRSYELPSISGSESVRVVRLLMSLEPPSPEVMQAIAGAVEWFKTAQLKGIKVVKVEDKKAPKGSDRRVVKDPFAPPMWARFYEIGTNRPIFSDRDGVAKRELAEIGYERRNGYSWLGYWPQGLLEKEYPAWKRKWDVQAQLDGEITLPGLEAPVEILRDRWGIAHIYAKNADDLFFAQGFVAAQDRLFQVDLWRRQGVGELAEVFGPSAVEADRFARLIRYRGDMEAEWASYAPDAKRIAIAFTRGINAYIDQTQAKLPVEFHILGIAPKKWQPEDVLGRMSGIYMSQNFRNEIHRAQVVAAAGAEKARWLAPVDPARAFGPAPGLDLSGIDERILGGYNAAVKLLAFEPPKTESNNWVVAGSRSVSGKPLLASDPHRAIALPSLRYLVHLNAPGWNVIGSGEPGLPGAAIGHNERIAWGFTIVGTDQADFFVEDINPKNADEYRVGVRWEKMTAIRETLHVKGEPAPRLIELRYTRHGPVFYHDNDRHRAYALKWAGSEPGGAAYLASLRVDRAANRDEFLQAMAAWKIPGLNFVYADKDGVTGWIAAALTPVRKNHDGLLPVPGSGGFEWQDYLSVAELPQSFDPKAGYLATANHNILPNKYPHTIGFEFTPPYRFQRIKDSLASKEKWDLADFRAIQHDDQSLPGLALGRLIKSVQVENKALERYVRLLADWNGRLTVDARAGPLYAVWLKELQDAFYSLRTPMDLKKALTTLGGPAVMLAALENPTENWFGPDPTAARNRLVRDTFARAVDKLNGFPERWGALHTVTFRHPLAQRDPALADVFNLGPFERPGDGHTPNNTRYDDNFRQIHGASYRHLFDLADWDRGLATSAPGQSGQPGSPHYADLLPLWANGDYFPLAYSRDKVEEVTENRLRLRPQAPRH